MGHKACPECSAVTGPASKKCPSCGFDFGIFVQKSPGPRPRSARKRQPAPAPPKRTKRTKTPDWDRSESDDTSESSPESSESEEEASSSDPDDSNGSGEELGESKSAGPGARRGPASNAELMARFRASNAAPSAEKNLEFLSPEDQERVRSAMQARKASQPPASSAAPSSAPSSSAAGPAPPSDPAPAAPSSSPSPSPSPAADLLLAPELAAKHSNARNGVNSGVVVLEADNFDDHNDELCWVCRDVGVLLCCDFCPKVFHKDCAGLGDDHSDRGLWECPECVRAKKQRNIASREAQLASMGFLMVGMTDGQPSEPLVLDERKAETIELDSFVITAFFPALPLSVALASRKKGEPTASAAPSALKPASPAPAESKASPAQGPSSAGSAGSRGSSGSGRARSSRGLFAPSPQKPATRSLGDSAPVVLSVSSAEKS